MSSSKIISEADGGISEKAYSRRVARDVEPYFCKRCREIKDTSRVWRGKVGTRYFGRRRCLDCAKVSSRRSIHRLSRIFWTRERLDFYRETQGGVCAVEGCRNTDLVMDHDHALETARALLCRNCNTAAGLLKEDIARIRGLAKYIDGWNPYNDSII